MKQLAGRLRELREASDRTLETAAEAVGMHAKHLQRIENGTVNITLKTLVAIVLAYGVTLADIFAMTTVTARVGLKTQRSRPRRVR